MAPRTLSGTTFRAGELKQKRQAHTATVKAERQGLLTPVIPGRQAGRQAGQAEKASRNWKGEAGAGSDRRTRKSRQGRTFVMREEDCNKLLLVRSYGQKEMEEPTDSELRKTSFEAVSVDAGEAPRSSTCLSRADQSSGRSGQSIEHTLEANTPQ
jgi:hypothetical protein